jgi:hypothetical protein
MATLPHSSPLAGNGSRTAGADRRPDPGLSGPPHPVSPAVSRLDRITLQLGVVVATVIALCSYAVSATSLYALGLQAGYSWWQAAAVPVVADGPAIYGMFRIVSRSRRGARGAGYGWLLVMCGTLASIGGNVAHAHPDLVAQAIAAAIPTSQRPASGPNQDAARPRNPDTGATSTCRNQLPTIPLACSVALHRAADTTHRQVLISPSHQAGTAQLSRFPQGRDGQVLFG